MVVGEGEATGARMEPEEVATGDVTQENTQNRPRSTGNGSSRGHKMKSPSALDSTTIMATGDAQTQEAMVQVQEVITQVQAATTQVPYLLLNRLIFAPPPSSSPALMPFTTTLPCNPITGLVYPGNTVYWFSCHGNLSSELTSSFLFWYFRG